MTTLAEFEDIRPYVDAEVRPTLDRLLNDPEFLDSVAKLKLPKLASWAPALLRPMVKKALKKETDGIDTVDDFQASIEKYMRKMLDDTTSDLSFSGLEHLSTSKACCFISNHRDIAMDPAFVNWILFQNGFQTLRIAIGDNLLSKPFASDLMRLNKCFIVNRSASAPREKLKAAKKLSSYIHRSVLEDNANIWIAQREGRAKDGLDITNHAIISMLALSKPKAEDFGEFIEQAHIVPVSISYEWDPCDADKARELAMTARDGKYEKAQHEDVQSIAKGISGFKGHVHLCFGEPFDARFNSVEEVALALDRHILENYVLHPSNCIAYEMLEKKTPILPVTKEAIPFTEYVCNGEREEMQRRYDAVEPAFRSMLLQIYANPVYAKLKQNNAAS